MFFSLIPNLEFSKQKVNLRFTETEYVLAKNIFRKISIDNSLYATDLFEEFFIVEGARPDFIAEQVYGNAFYDWVILVTNNITNVYKDWPMNQEDFERYIHEKYTDVTAAHHYETLEIKNDFGEVVQPSGITVYFDPNDPDSYTLRYTKYWSANSNGSSTIVEETITGLDAVGAVSNYEYEVEQNEKKRVVQILKPAYLPSFVKQFETGLKYLNNPSLLNKNTTSTLR